MRNRRQLSNFASKMNSIFGLREQGRELLTLLADITDCRYASLLFLDLEGDDFTVLSYHPEREDNPLSRLGLGGQHPIIKYLSKEGKVLTGRSVASQPDLAAALATARTGLDRVELLVPLISRGCLLGILALGQKKSGRYSSEDFALLQDIASRVAVSMEKEYLREQLSEREKSLSVLNRCCAIMTSSMDIPQVFGGLVAELNKVIDASWAAIAMVENEHLYLLALSGETDSAAKAGERMPLAGTAVEWVVRHQKSLTEPDLSPESPFGAGQSYLEPGLRSVVYLPLVAKGKAIGSLIVGSRRPHAYGQREMALLEDLAAQIAMPIENARLYAEIEEKARIDEITGLLNRRSLDEAMASEISRHSRYGGIFSLIILDLDSFKAFNDNYGHLAGDGLLSRIGSGIRKSIRNADRAFRYGGDEFAILLPQTPVDAASQVAERVRKQVASEVTTGQVPVTASLGLATWPADGTAASEVIAAADAALYQAKRRGGNQSRRANKKP